MKKLAAICLIATSLLCSCNRRMLFAYTDFISLEDLASFYVDTPDPLLNHPPFGQRLTIGWWIPRERFEAGNIRILATIRFRNHEDVVKSLNLTKRSGQYTLCFNRECFCNTGGILTYQLQLFKGEELLDEWKHFLWAKLIEFSIEDEEEIPIQSSILKRL